MAVIQRAPKLHPDAPPLWLPLHDAAVVEQASARPPDHVEGYDARSRIAALLLGSPMKMLTTISTALALLAFVALVPSLLGAGIGTLIKLALYQAWTLGLLLAATTRVRSISAATACRYWLVGVFTVAVISSFANDLVAGLASPSSVWITPLLEETLKAAPLAVAILMGRRAWRHPGLSDLVVVGFAVGAGYAFHEEALWERGAASGFELNLGLLVPSIFQQDGHFVVGQAVWTAIVAFAIGLFVLHRRHPVAVVAGIVVVFAVLGDHMSVNDNAGTLDVVRQLVFNGKLLGLIFVVAVIAAIKLDRARLDDMSVRDHLFPSERARGSNLSSAQDQDDPLHGLLASRYRRRRNGVHTTVSATAQQWPPRCETHAAPVAELARLGRAADVAVGPGTAATGWAPSPDASDSFRYVGPNGFTAHGATVDAASTGEATQDRMPDFWQYFALGVAAVGLYALVRLVTAGEASEAVLDTVIGLPDAPNSPALIVGSLGALVAAISLRDRDAADLDAGWAVGPGYDPSPERPDECEA